LYGLKRAPRSWNKVTDEWLVAGGFEPSKVDPCVCVYKKGGLTTAVVLYGGGVVTAGNNKAAVSAFKTAVSKRCEVKDLGALKRVLGTEVRRGRKERLLEVSQTAYTFRVLERFGTNCKPVSTPAEGRLLRDPGSVVDRECTSAVGSFLYAAVVSR